MIKSLIMMFLTLVSCKAATLSWEDTNNPPASTRYIISNKLNNGPWLWYTNTVSKSNFVILVPGTNWFSLTASNGLLSDPTVTNGNVPFKVFNIIIEAKNDLQAPWVTETNMLQFVTFVNDKRFYRLNAEIK